MEKDEYKKISDQFSKIIKEFFMTLSQILSHEFGIEMMIAGHTIYLHPSHTDIRASTFAMGSKPILLGIPNVLQKELEGYFQEIESEDLKKEIIEGFGKVLTKNKKPFIH